MKFSTVYMYKNLGTYFITKKIVKIKKIEFVLFFKFEFKIFGFNIFISKIYIQQSENFIFFRLFKIHLE